jgi:hypothetical protein
MASEAKQKNSAPRKSAKAEAASRAEGPSPTAGAGALQAPVTDQPAGEEPGAVDRVFEAGTVNGTAKTLLRSASIGELPVGELQLQPAGDAAPAADNTRERSTEAEGAAESAAAPKAPDAGEKGRFVILSPPVPADVPSLLLAGATYIVKAKPERGLRRAGRAFTREETLIPYADLSAGHRAAIEGEPDLVVTIRLPLS